MFKSFRDKIVFSGFTVLAVGLLLLILTFVSAYGFLSQSLSIIATEDLARTFGESLAPLIATCIRLMYLGIMGWIGSLVTIRGVTLIAHAPNTETATPQRHAEKEREPQPSEESKIERSLEEPKKPKEKEPEAKQAEPEIIVMPPGEAVQTQSTTRAVQSKTVEDRPSD